MFLKMLGFKKIFENAWIRRDLYIEMVLMRFCAVLDGKYLMKPKALPLSLSLAKALPDWDYWHCPELSKVCENSFPPPASWKWPRTEPEGVSEAENLKREVTDATKEGYYTDSDSDSASAEELGDVKKTYDAKYKSMGEILTWKTKPWFTGHERKEEKYSKWFVSKIEKVAHAFKVLFDSKGGGKDKCEHFNLETQPLLHDHSKQDKGYDEQTIGTDSENQEAVPQEPLFVAHGLYAH